MTHLIFTNREFFKKITFSIVNKVTSYKKSRECQLKDVIESAFKKSKIKHTLNT